MYHILYIRYHSQQHKLLGFIQSLNNNGPGQFCDGGTHPEHVGKKPEKSGNERNRKGINFAAVDRIRKKSENIGKIRKTPEMRGTGRGTILWRLDESGKSRKSR